MMHFGLLASTQDIGRDYWLTSAPGLRGVEVEIGPGDCGFLLRAAARHPDTLYVGIEIRAGCVARVNRRSDPVPPNFRLLNADGSWIVKNLLAADSVDVYHLYFPDPWWKKRHHKRRLVSGDFAAAVARTLRPGGCLLLATDVEPLFEQISATLQAGGLAREPWLRDPGDPACSSYERKYRRQGRDFRQARFCKPSRP